MNYIPAYVKVISFDIWGTLIKGGNQAFRAAKYEAVKNCLKTDDPLDYVHKLFSAADEYFDRLSEQTGVHFGFEDRIRFVHDRLTSKISTLTTPMLNQLDDQLGEAFVLNPPSLREEDLACTLANLSQKGYVLGVLSNTGTMDGRHLRKALEKLGIGQFFTFFIFSNEVKCAKPTSKIFQEIMLATNTQKHQILHVGDNHLADFCGATGAGLNALHLSQLESGVATIPYLRHLTD